MNAVVWRTPSNMFLRLPPAPSRVLRLCSRKRRILLKNGCWTIPRTSGGGAVRVRWLPSENSSRTRQSATRQWRQVKKKRTRVRNLIVGNQGQFCEMIPTNIRHCSSQHFDVLMFIYRQCGDSDSNKESDDDTASVVSSTDDEEADRRLFECKLN